MWYKFVVTICIWVNIATISRNLDEHLPKANTNTLGPGPGPWWWWWLWASSDGIFSIVLQDVAHLTFCKLIGAFSIYFSAINPKTRVAPKDLGNTQRLEKI